MRGYLLNLLLLCAYAHLAQVNGVPVETPCPEDSEGAELYSADSDSCNVFYKCDSGTWTEQKCSPGQVFKPLDAKCVPESEYPCGSTDANCKLQCLYGGTCVRNGSKEYCQCGPAFSGDTCEKFDMCILVTCMNGGTCSVLPLGIPHCMCPTGFRGTRCHKVDPCAGHTCENGGKCVVRQGAAHCKCVDFFSGPRCEVDVCESVTCQNGGHCYKNGNKGVCLCLPGFSGEFCQQGQTCSTQRCKNEGTCVMKDSKPSCVCAEGFYGDTCEHEVDCTGVVCQNGGHCVVERGAPSCVCPQRTSGQWCGRRHACNGTSPCENGGSCMDTLQGFMCDCPFGYTGTTCEEIRTCDQHDVICDNGKCEDTENGAMCSCSTGYKGAHCGIRDDDCGGCQNGGICKLPEFYEVDLGPKFCACPAGFSGELCETPFEDTLLCPLSVGQGQDRMAILVYPDVTSPSHVYICREGYLQRVKACKTRYNHYETRCLTHKEMETADKRMADIFYPSTSS